MGKQSLVQMTDFQEQAQWTISMRNGGLTDWKSKKLLLLPGIKYLKGDLVWFRENRC
jgi:hypothetical protein